MSDNILRRAVLKLLTTDELLDLLFVNQTLDAPCKDDRGATQVSSTRREGTVVQWDPRAGWGFVQCADRTRYFVHHHDVNPSSPGFAALVDGQQVSFDVVQTPKGLRAKNVAVLP